MAPHPRGQDEFLRWVEEWDDDTPVEVGEAFLVEILDAALEMHAYAADNPDRADPWVCLERTIRAWAGACDADDRADDHEGTAWRLLGEAAIRTLFEQRLGEAA